MTEATADFTRGRLTGDPTERLPARFAFDGPLGDLLLQCLQEDVRAARLSSKFKAYYRLRPWIPIGLRQVLQRGRNRQLEVDPDWYIPTQFATQFTAALQSVTPSRPVIHPWPDDYSMANVLTHDVETQEGVRLVSALADLEEEYGLRSCWNFIPYKYKIDLGFLSELQWRGHEVGVHGYNHDGRLFESRRKFEQRLGPINASLQAFRSVGFRAPMVHRNLLWQQGLEIDYDASCFDIDPFQAMPGGVGGVWPFFAGKFVELPYTLPQDHTLLVALGETTPDIWIRKFEWLRKFSGMALLITHPDYLDTPSKLDVYRQWLEFLSEQQSCWMALPREVATWWRQRDGLEILDVPDEPAIVGSAKASSRLTDIHSLFGELKLSD